MSAIPLARFLVEFGSEADPGQAKAGVSGSRAGEMPARLAQDATARIAAAAANGRTEGRAEAEKEFQAKLAVLNEQFEKRLDTERQAWAAAEGAALAERLLAALRDMEARIAESATRVLQPFLTEQLRSRAVAELVALVQAAVLKDRSAVISVSGPDDLIKALGERLAGVSGNVTYSAAATPDVTVVLDQTILQTRLEAWIAEIGGPAA